MLSSVILRIGAVLLLLLSAEVLGAKPTSFCKCTCNGSYKIIPLDARNSESAAAGGSTSPNRRSLDYILSSRSDVPLALRADNNKDGDHDSDKPGHSPESSAPDNEDKDKSKDGDQKDDNTDDDDGKDPKYRAKSCNDCNRSFCLAQNLPECKDASDNTVFATCFQRDSSKDEAVVFIFIFTTVGLLSWALLKPCLDSFRDRRRERSQYIPVAGQAR